MREKRVLLADLEVELNYLSLDDIVCLHGIDPTQPYTQIDIPEYKGHLFIQRIED